MAQLGKAWMKRSSTIKIGVLANRMWRFNKNNLGTIIGAGWFLNFSVLLQIGAYKNQRFLFCQGIQDWQWLEKMVPIVMGWIVFRTTLPARNSTRQTRRGI